MQNFEFDINGVLQTTEEAKSVVLENMSVKDATKIFDNFKGYPQKVGGITFYMESASKDNANKALLHITEKISDFLNYKGKSNVKEIVGLFNGISEETITHILELMTDEKQIKKVKNGYAPLN